MRRWATRIATGRPRIGHLAWPLAVALFFLWHAFRSWADPRPWYSSTWNRLQTAYLLALALACLALALAELVPSRHRHMRPVLRLASLALVLGAIVLFLANQRVGLAEH